MTVARARRWVDALDLVALEAACACVATAATLRWRGPSALARLAAALPERRHPAAEADVEHVVAQVDRVARHLALRSPCLVRSSTAQMLLARRGVPTELRIGVRRDGDVLDAHAWLERDGVMLNDTVEHCEQYAAFAEPVELVGRVHVA